MLDAVTECPFVEEEHSDEDQGSTPAPDGSAASVDFRVDVHGSDADLTILPVNFTPRAPQGDSRDPNFGHYHIYLDKVPVDVITGSHSHEDGEDAAEEDHDEEMDGGLVENPAMWVENSFSFTGLEPGVHTATIVLNYDDHTPLDPPVIASQTFTVGGGDHDDGGIPAWTLIVAVIGGLVVGSIGMKFVSRG
jgi:hypothetical protein